MLQKYAEVAEKPPSTLDLAGSEGIGVRRRRRETFLLTSAASALLNGDSLRCTTAATAYRELQDSRVVPRTMCRRNEPSIFKAFFLKSTNSTVVLICPVDDAMRNKGGRFRAEWVGKKRVKSVQLF